MTLNMYQMLHSATGVTRGRGSGETAPVDTIQGETQMKLIFVAEFRKNTNK